MFEKGLFGDMFDFDRDGKLNAAERALEFMAFEQMLAEEKECRDEEENDSFRNIGF
ncbi:MAG: hypothetical protein IKM11_06490 [Oscillospiraceae bacterium]|nr:hypothetical protein [Oscillospiraceae bacterium]